MPMQEGNEFVDFKAFKAVMQYWAMTGVHKFNMTRTSGPKASPVLSAAKGGYRVLWLGTPEPDRSATFILLSHS